MQLRVMLEFQGGMLDYLQSRKWLHDKKPDLNWDKLGSMNNRDDRVFAMFYFILRILKSRGKSFKNSIHTMICNIEVCEIQI